MKINIALTISLMSISLTSNAQTEYTNENAFLKNVPEMTSGIEIVNSSKMNMPASIANENKHRLEQQKKFGYIESDTPNPKLLMAIKASAPAELIKFKNTPSPYDTHLKKNISNIKLGFKYQGAPIPPYNSIGFAPSGTVVNEKWTAIKEYFTDKELGTCSLSVYHLKLSNMGIKINAEALTYLVNNYPTTYEVEGNKKSGYIYSISWVTPTFSKDLSCANNNYDPNITKALINLARKIN